MLFCLPYNATLSDDLRQKKPNAKTVGLKSCDLKLGIEKLKLIMKLLEIFIVSCNFIEKYIKFLCST